MSAKVKVSGEWLESSGTYVKVSGVWKLARSAWQKIDGVWKNWFLQGGLLDRPIDNQETFEPNFITNTGLGVAGSANRMTIQPDGKILLGGFFSSFNGIAANGLVRLNSDGTTDTAFTANSNAALQAQSARAIAIQSDGKVLRGGGTKRIARLNSDGTLDAAFNNSIGTGASDEVWSAAVQSDEKIVLGGYFTSFNGTASNRVVRLNSNGTIDTAFVSNIGTGIGSTESFPHVESIAIQSDGKIILGGRFLSFNGATVNRIVRLNADGTRDTAFTTNTGTGASGTVFSIAIQSDGKIVISGSFATFNGATVNRIVRLNADGTRDTAFTTNTGTGADFGNISSIAIQSDGKIILGGSFTSFNGPTARGIVRINSDGTRDSAFITNTNVGVSVNGSVQALGIQPDGKIVLGGNFNDFNGSGANGVFRLNADGTSPLFPGPNALVRSVAASSDAKILIGGDFTFFNGTAANRIIRLNSDNTIDSEFLANIGTGITNSGSAMPFITAIAIQSNGKIIVGGNFSFFNGTFVPSLIRLNANGTLDTEFMANPNSTIRSIVIQSDGKIVVGGDFTTFNGTTANRIARLNADGTLDTEFLANTGTGANSRVVSVAVQSDGKILIGGRFTAFNGVTANRTARLSANGTLEVDFGANIGAGANNDVNGIALQLDGKILIGGSFTTFRNITTMYIVRLNPNGTRDTSFTIPSTAGEITTIASDPIGRIFVGARTMIRFNIDGTQDFAFANNIGNGPDKAPTSFAFEQDGKVVIGGDLVGFNNQLRYKVARIGGGFAG